jgi:hypothetical protein
LRQTHRRGHRHNTDRHTETDRDTDEDTDTYTDNQEKVRDIDVKGDKSVKEREIYTGNVANK